MSLKPKFKYSIFILLALSLIIYIFYPRLTIALLNQQIDIDGMKLLMNFKKAESTIKRHSMPLEGFEPQFHRYKSKTLELQFDKYVGSYKDKIIAIDAYGTNHSIFGVHIGEPHEKMISALKRNGFKSISNGNKHNFKRGYTSITVLADESHQPPIVKSIYIFADKRYFNRKNY